MTNTWTNRWNERYSKAEFAYGELPNEYLKEQIAKLKIGSILFPAEGEGRNAVYAATLVLKFRHLILVIKEKAKPYYWLKPIMCRLIIN